MNVPAFLTETDLDALIERNELPTPRPRYRLLRDVPEVDLQAGAIGSVIGVASRGDDRGFVLLFDCRPGLRVTFYDPEFMPGSPEYLLEAM